MNLSIIIVSWNVEALLKKCLTSIYAARVNFSFEVFVVDNASSDGTTEMVKNNFPQVKLIASSENLGFARANNRAIKEATGEYILLLNPDTEVFPDTLEKSLSFMKARPDCGIMGCQLLNPDKSLQPSVRRFPSVWPIFLMLIKLPKLFPHLKSVDNYLAKDFNYQKIQTVDQIMGAYMFIRREVFNRVGLLDERFFIWFEEVDLCRRAAGISYKIYYFPEAQIIHYGGQSFAQQKVITKQFIFFRSAWHYFIKNGFFNK